jgi:hypothetical protein
VIDLVHALPDTDGGGEMTNMGDTRERNAKRGAVANISFDALDFRVQMVGKSWFCAVHLLIECIDHSNASAALGQLIREVRTDESSAAGHEHERIARQAGVVGSTA